jgi:hypothetical protein
MSLVQAVGSATTVFGVALSLPFPALGREDLSRQELTRKGAAALGVAFINR